MSKANSLGEGVVSVSNLRAHDQGNRSIIDDAHLRRMTLDDPALEREVLAIFVRQASLLLSRIGDQNGRPAVEAAHTLAGSAAGIGAWRVADAAGRLERLTLDGSRAADEALAELQAAVLETSIAIGRRLAGA